MRAGARLEEARDARPQRTGDEAGDQRDDHVQREGQVEREADAAGGGGRHEHLAAAADVEHADAERERDTEARRDERGRERERLGERPDRTGEGRRAEVVDRALEERAVRAGDGIPDRGERVAGTREEVLRGGLHVLVRDGDQDAADDEGEDDGEHRDDGVALRDLAGTS